MRYRRKEIGCEVRYSKLDLRALDYIAEFMADEENGDLLFDYKNRAGDNCLEKVHLQGEENE